MFCSCPLFSVSSPATTEIYTLSLHDALPISTSGPKCSRPMHSARSRRKASSTRRCRVDSWRAFSNKARSEEHTSELQSRENLVCRLLLEKKNKTTERTRNTSKNNDIK